MSKLFALLAILLCPTLAYAQLQGGTASPWTPKLLNALTNSAVAVKNGPGQVGMLQCYNPNSGQAYVQVFNLAAASVSLGTTVPLLSVTIGPTATGGFAIVSPGIGYSVAISVAATTTATGSTGLSTAVDCNMAYN